MVGVISIYAIFKIKSVNKVNLAECIFLKEKRMDFWGSYMPIFCIFILTCLAPIMMPHTNLGSIYLQMFIEQIITKFGK